MHDQPNVLMILCDQLRADFLHAYGGPDLTPNIDRLARRGVVFERAYCSMPMCITSRMTLLTGMHPACCPPRIPDHVPTAPAVFAAAGYDTVAIGKMHMQPPRGPYGFRHLRLSEDTGPGMFLDDYHAWLAHQGHVEWDHGLDNCDIMPAESLLPEHLTVTHWDGEQTVEYLKTASKSDRPFYAVASFAKPHPPYDPPRPWSQLVVPSEVPMPLGLERTPSDYPEVVRLFRDVFGNREIERLGLTRRVRAAYLGLVAQIDHEIGRILDALENEGLADNTLVVFSADHGDMLGDHHQYMKFFAYEASARIPLIFAGPGIRPARCATPVSNLDIMPTLLSSRGVLIPSTCQGINLLRMSDGDEGVVVDPALDGREGVMISLCLGPGYGWVHGALKYTLYPNGEEELIDLAADPHETRNLALSPSPELAAARAGLNAALQRFDRERLDGMPPLLTADGRPRGGNSAFETIQWFKNRYYQHHYQGK